MKAISISPNYKQLIKSASRKLKGSDKRQFIAEVAESLCENSPRLAETVFGFCRQAVQLGIHERRTGLICYGAHQDAGRKKSEELLPKLEADIRALVDPESQADPQMRNTFAYTRITAQSLRQQLIEAKGWKDEQLPKRRTLLDILNRLGYTLRKVQKTKPQKKIPETDAIFKNIRDVTEEARQNKKTLHISIDCKAVVCLGDFSRGGKSRGAKAVKALDHDMATKEKMVPFGILNLESDQLDIIYGSSHKTSDFIVDALEIWWDRVEADYRDRDTLIINADNGPECSSNRTQFLLRMVQFSKRSGLKIRLAYYPPYHSKYNPIERSWSSLENHWSGTLLNSVHSVLEWTKTMTWKCIHPIVNFIKDVYQKGVKLSKEKLEEIMPHIARHPDLAKWDITITPEPVDS